MTAGGHEEIPPICASVVARCRSPVSIPCTSTLTNIPHETADDSAVVCSPLSSCLVVAAQITRPGDVFFCPADWWHTTKVISVEPSVTFGGNYVDESNKNEFAGRWREHVAAQKLVASGGFSVLAAPLPTRPLRPAHSRCVVTRPSIPNLPSTLSRSPC